MNQEDFKWLRKTYGFSLVVSTTTGIRAHDFWGFFLYIESVMNL